MCVLCMDEFRLSLGRTLRYRSKAVPGFFYSITVQKSSLFIIKNPHFYLSSFIFPNGSHLLGLFFYTQYFIYSIQKKTETFQFPGSPSITPGKLQPDLPTKLTPIEKSSIVCITKIDNHTCLQWCDSVVRCD